MLVRNSIIIAALWLSGLGMMGQTEWLSPLSNAEYQLQKRSDTIHTALRPFILGMDPTFETQNDSLNTSQIELSAFGAGNAGFQYMDNDAFVFGGQAGAMISLHHKDKLFFNTTYIYALEQPIDYIARYTDSLNVLPSIGYARDNGFALQSHYYSGNLSWNINEVFNLEAGNGKHFWGDGYRSLILSHNAAPYPYLKLTTDIWKIRYVNLWTKMKDISRPGGIDDSRNKYMALHALSMNLNKRLNISIYEMVIWQAKDTLSDRGVDLNYMNPIIFYRPVEFAQGSADNVILGFSFKYKVEKRTQIYGQFLLDELLFLEFTSSRGWWGNKFGYQIGFKQFDLATEGLHLQSEFNIVRPFTYTHGSVTQAYGHMNQALAHPLGTNFVEWVTLMKYETERWSLSNKFIWAIYGRNRDGENFGGDVFSSYKNPRRQYGNYWAQGLKTTVNFEELTFSYLLSPKNKIWGQFTTGVRYESNEFNKYWDGWITVGLKMDLIPGYRDF